MRSTRAWARRGPEWVLLACLAGRGDRRLRGSSSERWGQRGEPGRPPREADSNVPSRRPAAPSATRQRAPHPFAIGDASPRPRRARPPAAIGNGCAARRPSAPGSGERAPAPTRCARYSQRSGGGDPRGLRAASRENDFFDDMMCKDWAFTCTCTRTGCHHEVSCNDRCLLKHANPAWQRGLQSFDDVQPQGPYGIRTRAAAVRGRCPRPLDEWAVATAKCSEPLSAGRPLPAGYPSGRPGLPLASQSAIVSRVETSRFSLDASMNRWWSTSQYA
jgi:hypothetical protein